MPEHFDLAEGPLPTLAAGQVLLRHEYLGLAPAARIRMSAEPHYAEPTPVGEPIYGQAIGRVVRTLDPSFAIGDRVMSMNAGWQTHSVARSVDLIRIPADEARPTLYLGLLGSSGFTAFVGLHDIARIAPDETVVVSAAAGAVGSAAVQMARLHGCRVIGVASGRAKCREVVESWGAVACVDRAEPTLAAALRAACSDGVDVYFDNSGGAVRDAVWPLLRDWGRVAVCGQIATYNAAESASGPDWMSLLTRRLCVRGFLLRDHGDRAVSFRAVMADWLAAGMIDAREHVWDGLESAPAAFAALLDGQSHGKVIVRLAD